MAGRVVNRSERLAQIERILLRNNQGLRVVEIAKACGVDRRTIYRDLATLEQSGVPVSQQDGRVFINREYYLASVRLNFNETIALFLAVRMFSRQADQQNPHLLAALTKLEATLPGSVGLHISYLVEAMRGLPIDRNFVQILETITRGWVERRKVRVWAGSSGPADFSVYFLEPAATGGLYVVGYDDIDACIRTLRVEAIRRAKLLEVGYELPTAFDRRPYFASAWGIGSCENSQTVQVTLAFAADVTPLIKERTWHASQRLETLADKRCTLTVHVSDWHDLLPWIRSGGAQVEVLEPQELRDELTAEATRIIKRYSVSPRPARV